jgi:hypothetical protein
MFAQPREGLPGLGWKDAVRLEALARAKLLFRKGFCPIKAAISIA